MRKMLLIGLAAMATASCNGERDADDGEVINAIALPTDVVLNLACENVGIVGENCVLGDPENPFVTTAIIEFDPNNPGAENKFDLFNAIPAGPTGAKARFYFWATALARRPSGENQFYTALALHELFDANSNVLSTDELVRAQALKAYRSVLDNFFGSVTVFTCCPGASPTGEPVAFAIPLNELTADNLYRTNATGYRRLVDGDPILVLQLFVEWGYSYQPATPPNFDNGVITVGEF
ncbi:MAG: hypothetical protein OEY74_01940 [Gammaproteobacteria bacterium]|nr:hypothetical protein [Gammaproteobacteria bacterium]